jgi:hypothetical protein
MVSDFCVLFGWLIMFCFRCQLEPCDLTAITYMLKGTLQFYIYNDECFLISLLGFCNSCRYCWQKNKYPCSHGFYSICFYIYGKLTGELEGCLLLAMFNLAQACLHFLQTFKFSLFQLLFLYLLVASLMLLFLTAPDYLTRKSMYDVREIKENHSEFALLLKYKWGQIGAIFSNLSYTKFHKMIFHPRCYSIVVL